MVVDNNPIRLRMAKTLWSFGHSVCNTVKHADFLVGCIVVLRPR